MMAHTFNASSFCSAATGFLLFCAAVHVPLSSPASLQNVQEDELIVNLTKQIYWGMEIFTVLDRDVDVGIDDIKYLRNVSIIIIIIASSSMVMRKS